MTPPRQPNDHDDRLDRARLALKGLSVGDAFGGGFFLPPEAGRAVPPPPWRYSDDTAMALALVEVLHRHRGIEPEELARLFVHRYQADPYRGYGLSVRRVLERIAEGIPWSNAAREVYGGEGSMGNGGAMRVAPLGAYLADDLDETVEQARASAAVTHAHPEGQAGAVAVAVAAAWAWNARHQPRPRRGEEMLAAALDRTPEGETRAGLVRASALALDRPVAEAAALLGNGSRITAPDTVPYALWCAARHLDDYAEALWAAVLTGGDNDTNCAIVGGVVVLANGPEAIPADWLASREPLTLSTTDS
jgi:ADP-ribosylglycohydrolase